MSQPITKPRNLVSWDELHQRALIHDDLTESERLAAAKAILELRSILGERFFEVNHQLVGFFINRAAWPLKWAIWFAGVLGAIRRHPDFSRLIADLQNRDRYGERMMILNIVDILSTSGFTFTLDKEIQINGRPKRPDLFVMLDTAGPGLFIEVTSMGESDKQAKADEVFHAVGDAVWPAFGSLEVAGRVERVLSPRHLEEVLEKVKFTVAKALNETGFESLEIDSVIRLGVATQAKAAQLKDWAESRGLKLGEFAGPAVSISEIDRLSRALREKQEQLPPDEPNVVVIYSHLFPHSPYSEETFSALANSIEDVVYRYSHIGYLVLVFSWTGVNSKESYRFRDHLCVNRQRFDFQCQTFMLFKNRFAEKPMPANIEQQFLKAFLDQTGEL